MRRDTQLLYPALLAAAAASIVLVPPIDEDAISAVAPEPRPELIEVDGLSVERAAGLPPFRARRAFQAEPAAPLVLGGAVAGVLLEGVEVPLPSIAGRPTPVLSAERGELADGRLSLERVRVTEEDRVVLSSGAATIAGDRITFPGLVALRPGTAEQVVERGVELSLAELAARLHGR